MYRAITDALGRTTDGKGFRQRSMTFFVVDSRTESIVKTHTLRYAPKSIDISPMSRDSVEFTERKPYVNRYGLGLFDVSISGNTGRQAIEIADGIRIDGASHILDMTETFIFANGGMRDPDSDMVMLVNDANELRPYPLEAIRIDWLNWGAPRAKDKYWHDLYSIVSTGKIISRGQSAAEPMTYAYSMSFQAEHRMNALRLEPSDPLSIYLIDGAVMDDFVDSYKGVTDDLPGLGTA